MKITLLLCSLLLLVSCGSSEGSNNNDTATTNTKSDIVITTQLTDSSKVGQQKQIAVTYDEETLELNIGDIIVKKGIPKDLPKGLEVLKGATSYINSNVPNYYFLFTDQEKDTIFDSYKKGLTTNKWREIKAETTKEETEGSIGINDNILTFKRGYQTVTIQFYSNIPENLRSLETLGNYVEVQYY